jgi:formylglycine-generating enzyme required for sulfatase activity
MKRTLFGLAALAFAGNLAACFSSQNVGSQPDAGPEDASSAAPDAGTPDAPPGDATLGDASSTEASVADVAPSDAPADTSAVDSGADSGAGDAAPDVIDGGYDASTVSPCGALDAGGAPSCAAGGPGMTNCGTSSECCCASPEVTGGTYYRTYDYGAGPMDEADPATISGFRLDTYDVTVGRFRQFVDAVLPVDGGAGWVPPAGSGKHTHLNGGQGLVDVSADAGTVYETGWLASYDGNVAPTTANLTTNCFDNQGYATYATWTSAPGSQETLPIICMNWFEAYAFCIWDGGFLPSEAEWEYAAAGGSQQRHYPWGTAQPTTANQYANINCSYPTGSPSCVGLPNIWPVGTAPMGAGLWGQLDLAGNVWQANMDWYAGYVSPCTDCAYLSPQSGGRQVRGGNYDNSYEDTWTRNIGWSGTSRFNTYGFRCARVP